MTGIGPRNRRVDRRISTRERRPRLEPLEARQLLAVVINTNDEGPGSLRQAILDTNSDPNDNVITFNIPGTGVRVITVGATTNQPLPTITEPVTIDGPTPPTNSGPEIEITGADTLAAGSNGLVFTGGASTLNDLVITGFSGHGVVLRGNGGNRITGTHIGVRTNGTTGLGNDGDGILIDNSPNNTIGDTTTATRNIIGANGGSGIQIAGANALENRIQNNFIGTNATATGDLGNGGSGVLINNASRNTIGGTTTGTPNTIAFNDESGVTVIAGDNNAIRRNSMFSNGVLGISLENGGNNDVPAPVLTFTTTTNNATRVQGRLTGGSPTTTYSIEYFSNTNLGSLGHFEGRTFVSSQTITTDASGNANIDQQIGNVALNRFVGATVTDPDGDTSEFSNPTLNLAPVADLTLTGSTSLNPAARNGYVTYTYVVSNAGPSEAAATFTTTLPSTLSFVQATSTSGTVSRDNNTITIAFSSLAAGSTATISILVVPTSTGTINTTATITSPIDPNSGDNTVSLATQVVEGINLVVSGTANPTSIALGETVAFQFLVTNGGGATSTGTTMTERLPDAFEFVSATTTQGAVTADPATGLIGASLGNLAPSASAVVTIVVRPKVQGALYNGMLASGNEPEMDASSNFGVASVIVNPPAPPTPPDTVAPTVTRLSRFGTGTQPTSLLIGFSEQLEVSPAQDLANYGLVTAGRDGRFGTADDVAVGLQSALYDSVNQAVTLTTRQPVSLATPIQLTINGTTPTGVRGLDGLLLDGANTGQAGSNFVRTFRGFGPGVLTGSASAADRRTTR